MGGRGGGGTVASQNVAPPTWGLKLDNPSRLHIGAHDASLPPKFNIGRGSSEDA